jgi:SAM-dependent methyltransferase
LRRFSQEGNWELHGLDINDRSLPRLRSIPGFTTLHTCSPGEVAETFDVITVIHTLEHVPEPARFLRELLSRLDERGALLIQVPNAAENPFDYAIADHLSHFRPETLRLLLERAGFAGTAIFTDWIPKEISALAWRAPESLAPTPDGNTAAAPAAAVSWLQHTIEAAAAASERSPEFGLFGSSIAATWLWSSVANRVRFFVDQDPGRVARRHLECPILSPDQVPPGASVFLGVAPRLAHAVLNRLQPRPYEMILPPPLPAE